MADIVEPSLGEPQPSPRLGRLIERLTTESVYSVIADVLMDDYIEMSAYRQAHEDMPEGTSSHVLNQDIVRLYGLEPEEVLTTDLLDGFYDVAHLHYREIVDADSGTVPSGADISHVPVYKLDEEGEITQTDYLGHDDPIVSTIEALNERVSSVRMGYLERIRASLGNDPSGGNWLRAKAEKAYPTGGPELVGANRAITGAVTLYYQLAPHIPSR